MRSLKVSCLLCLFVYSTSIFSQEKFLGKVKNFNGDAITDAIVYIDNKKTDIKTNSRGYFEVELPADTKTISVLSPTYGLLNANYNKQKALSFVYVNEMYEPETKGTSNDASEADEVSVGYAKVDRGDSSFGTNVVDFDKQNESKVFTSIYDLIRARLKGVRVTSNNKIIIRGVNSLRSSSDPLFVVNGQIVQDISYIVPVDVKNVNVLKGAAAAIYGARGANGVIEITLKS